MASGTGIDEAVRGAKNFGWSWGTIEKEKENRFTGAGQSGVRWGGRGNLRPHDVAFAPTLPPSDTSSRQRRKARTQNNTRAAPAVARPSSNLSLFLPPIIIGREVVPCQSLPPPSPPSLPVSWPDSPLSGAGARNPRLGSLIDLTADRAATDQSPILALTPPRAD